MSNNSESRTEKHGLNALGEMVATSSKQSPQKIEASASAESEEAYFERLNRRASRIKKWLKNKSRADIESHLAWLFLLMREIKAMQRAQKSHLSELERIASLLSIEARVFRARSEAFKEVALDEMRTNIATQSARSSGAEIRWANDPRRIAKPEVFDLWRKWQSGVTRYANGAAFDRAMTDQFPAIKDTKTIFNWRKEWMISDQKNR